MNLDFSLVLTVLACLTGSIWLIDALFFAKARNTRNAQLVEGTAPESPNWITEQAKSFTPVLLIVLAIRSFCFEPFQIPSGSMIPTLMVGDFIVVNKFAYGLRLPVTNQKFMSIGAPKRGDVVIFKRPLRNGYIQDEHTGLTFVKRCVGLPGDRISFYNHEFLINGQPISSKNLGPFKSDASSIVNATSQLQSEDLAGVVHQSLISNFQDPRINGEWVVPAGQYFVMGDNRDGSSDSRDWGFVPEENLMGRASFVWFHWDWQRKGVVAWNRIGLKVR